MKVFDTSKEVEPSPDGGTTKKRHVCGDWRVKCLDEVFGLSRIYDGNG
jgi:hypothetical protein